MPDPDPSANNVWIKYPPFPAVPKGVTIIPFSKFKENGIRLEALIRPREKSSSSKPTQEQKQGVESGDEDDGLEYLEVDGLGIPTVELKTSHGKDVGKTEAAKKRKINRIREEVRRKEQDRLAKIEKGQAQRREWWEVWEDGEALRLKSYDPRMTRLERLQLATEDFKSGRQWPTALAGLSDIWSHWRIFTGLSKNARPHKQVFPEHTTAATDNIEAKDNPFGDNDGMDDDEDEDDDFGYMGDGAEMAVDESAYTEEGAENSFTNEGDGSTESMRMIKFLNNIEKTTKIFLGPYMRKEGMVWSDKYLTIAPRLLRFYFNFLLRNHVFPEKHHLQGIQASLALIDRAATELPMITGVSRIYPDEIGASAQALWGAKSESFFNCDDAYLFSEPEKDVKMASIEEVDEEEGKGNVIKDGAIIGGGTGRGSGDWGSAATGAWGEAADADGWDKTADVNGRSETTNASGWGDATNASSWGTAAAESASGSSGASVKVTSNGGIKTNRAGGGQVLTTSISTSTSTSNSVPAPTWNFMSSETENGWDDKKKHVEQWETQPHEIHSFLKVFGGPTALPVTHTTGVVECSMRRLVEIVMPSDSPVPPVSPTLKLGPNAKAVEQDLSQRFARATFEPWLDWDPRDECSVSTPRVVGKTSRGAAIDVPLKDRHDHQSLSHTSSFSVNGSSTASNGVKSIAHAKGGRVHDVYKDRIVVLIEKSVAEVLMKGVGMGYGGTWVQIVRQEGQSGGEGGDEDGGYWYMDQLTHVLPSFWCTA
ncbi:hypothetical protein AX16_002136 [Volvariella volvacea WC 439]|nr:hypothetical protein AX16_002136 [Volvariella volvacea WC 439]